MIQLTYSISSRTPIVTGDSKSQNKELQASGLLGSLRYQYWLLKAMQAWQKKQPYPHCSAELPPAGSAHFTEKLHEAGPVVWLFGATNWKKMFRLEIAEAAQGEQQSCSSRSDSKAPCQWTFKLIFHQDRTSSIFTELAEQDGMSLADELHSLMAFVHHYGWLGAAPQNGLGWVRVECENAAGKRHEMEKTGCIIPPPANPVFAAKDVELPASCVKNLLVNFRDFYVPKQEDARKKLENAEEKLRKFNVARKDYRKDKEWRTQHSRKTRYDTSLHLLNQKNKEFPVGYEIRRWLREQMLPLPKYKKEQELFFGCGDHASFVYVTHPVIQPDGSWQVRLRFAVRPDKVGDTTRLYPPAYVNLTPQTWLDSCEKFLNQERLS